MTLLKTIKISTLCLVCLASSAFFTNNHKDVVNNLQESLDHLEKIESLSRKEAEKIEDLCRQIIAAADKEVRDTELKNQAKANLARAQDADKETREKADA